MNVLIQGMRRSGTTILFDILWEDNNLDCYYEPLAADKKPALGGGSGVRSSVDYFKKIRRFRAEFMTRFPELECTDLLNYGAPRQPELEFETDLPNYCREYIKLMLSQSEYTVIKFTRMYCKVRVLWEIDPDAKFIHLVRDPRSIATSYLFGKNQKYRDRFPCEKLFFKRKSEDSAWSSYPFSEFLLHTPEYTYLQRCEDFIRILLLWKYTLKETHKMGKALFGKNYFMFRHEDLQKDSVKTVESLYNFLELPLSQYVVDWAVKHVQPFKTPFAAVNKHWGEAFKKLGMEEELELASYSDCLTLCQSSGLLGKLHYMFRLRR